MTALLIILATIAMLVAGYIAYGGWLAKKWGIDPKRKTPAHTMRDGVDYVAAPPAVLMGHHFSSIAGAGPINGPIQASVFGWVPVFLWCVLGGIFFGGLMDFGAMFASIRNNGRSVGEIIRASIGERAKRLFITTLPSCPLFGRGLRRWAGLRRWPERCYSCPAACPKLT